MGGPERERVTHICHFTGGKGKWPDFRLPMEDVGLCCWKPRACTKGLRSVNWGEFCMTELSNIPHNGRSAERFLFFQITSHFNA